MFKEPTPVVNAGQKLTKAIYEKTTPDALERNRNLFFGAAAVLLVVLVQLVQMTSLSLALRVSLFSSAIGIPLLVALGMWMEFYLLLGPASYPHFVTRFRTPMLHLVQAVAYVAIIVCVGAVVYHMSRAAAACFGAASIVAVLLSMGLHANLAVWWFDGQRDRESSPTESDKE